MAKFTIERPQQGGNDAAAPAQEQQQIPISQQATNAYQGSAKWFGDTFGPNGNLRGSAIGGVMQGMADPVVGAVQLAANIPGVSSVVGDPVNASIASKESEYESARAAAGRSGFDAARFAGNVAAPSNVALASRIPAVSGSLARAGVGSIAGGVGAAATPQANTENYWQDTGGRAATGAAIGAVLAPVGGAIGDRLGRFFNGPGSPGSPGGISSVSGPPGTHPADPGIAAAAKEAGQTIDDVPQSVLYKLRAQADHALSQNQTLDTAAALRRADFESLGLQPLLGQITRDPMQSARERNLRGIAGAGEPIAARLAGQTRVLRDKIGAYANGASEAFPSGQQLSGDLAKIDGRMQRAVSAEYGAARNSAGKSLKLPLQGLAQDYADVLRRFGDKVPSGVRNGFEDLGLNSGTQRRIFDFEEADNLRKILSDNTDHDPGTIRAISELRRALNRAQTDVDVTGGPFAPAVKMAAERFKLREAIPALQAAADGAVAPDQFVNRFVVNGNVLELRGLAKLLKEHAPESYQQARAQIGDELRRAAHGENTTGDKVFSPERFNRRLRQIGTARLEPFFTPSEIAEMRTIGRVGANMESPPAGSAWNFSNSASGVANFLLDLAPGQIKKAVGAARWASKASENESNLQAAMRAEVPRTANSSQAPTSRRLSDLLMLGTFGAGASSGRQ
ncbi:hypothetical protein UFOVP935_15 [uncultured Caudovirales phage]|uniref:Uncharacterized protein n=1 Tax=uncultured Caudovirales phage TaxID=2100421 RepID=A0A6J5PR10_9CAUD|nr:hypothetical protein UFOVP935_15 [uncultured Caudovirales phage]